MSRINWDNTQLNKARGVETEQVLIDLDVPVINKMILCPWHEERTPSCKVNDFCVHCFGCGITKDNIDLVMYLKECRFQEAIDYLQKFDSQEIVKHKKTVDDLEEGQLLTLLANCLWRDYFDRLDLWLRGPTIGHDRISILGKVDSVVEEMVYKVNQDVRLVRRLDKILAMLMLQEKGNNNE